MIDPLSFAIGYVAGVLLCVIIVVIKRRPALPPREGYTVVNGKYRAHYRRAVKRINQQRAGQ